MLTYRVTRPSKYPVGSAGFNDTTAREGYYIEALSPNLARDALRKQFPYSSGNGGISLTESLDTELVKPEDIELSPETIVRARENALTHKAHLRSVK